MKGPLYLCADIGGTQIKTGLLDGAGRLVGAIHREDAQAGLPQQPLLDHIAAACWYLRLPLANVANASRLNLAISVGLNTVTASCSGKHSLS